MKGTVLHDYVAAYDANNKVVAGKGSSGSPNIIELSAGLGTKPDGEDPINGKKPPGGGTGSGGAVTGGGVVAPQGDKMYVGVVGGTGFGYVTGKTELNNTVENCCIGNSLVVITPELGYYVNPQLSIGLAVRLGVPVGANIDGHSTLACSAASSSLWLHADLDGAILGCSSVDTTEYRDGVGEWHCSR